MKLKATENFEKISREFFKYKWRIVAAWGGSRSGKTYAILQILILYALRAENKGKSITIWRKTRSVCKQTVMKDFIRILNSDDSLRKKFHYDKTHSIFTCKKTNVTIQFEGADDDSKVHGSQQDVSYFNEITEMQEKVFDQIDQRTNDFILADYNPSKSFWFDRKERGLNSIFIHSTYLNNSECPPNIVKKLNSYKPIDDKLIGEDKSLTLSSIKDVKEASEYIKSIVTNIDDFYDLFLGWSNTIFGKPNKYMYDVYCLGLKSEKPEKIYNGWIKISLSDYLKISYKEYNGLDIGTSSPTALVGVKTDGKNFFIRKKAYKPSKTEGGVINILDSVVARGDLSKSDMIIVDSAKLAYVDMLKRNGYFGEPAIKGSGSLESGIETLQSLNIYYVEDNDIESEYDEYSYHLDKFGDPTDIPISKNDHALDAIRYAITYLIWFLNIKVGKRF